KKYSVFLLNLMYIIMYLISNNEKYSIIKTTLYCFQRFWIFVVIIFFSYKVQSIELEDPDYGPQAKPYNVPRARQALGYDKYEKQPVQSSRQSGRKFYPYGNNWEDFDIPPIGYKFGYNS